MKKQTCKLGLVTVSKKETTRTLITIKPVFGMTSREAENVWGDLTDALILAREWDGNSLFDLDHYP